MLSAPIDELERIAGRYFSRSALRTTRLERRNEAIRRLAVELFAAGKATKGCALASLIAGLLRRRDAPAVKHRFNLKSGQSRRTELVDEILVLGRGRCLSRETLRRILAGVGQKKRRQCANDGAISNA